MHDVETIIVGAGVVGLAVARARSLAGEEVVILEQNDLIGSETSARNSEVIHAGIYYPMNSLKARTCVEGKNRLYEFCRTHGVPHKNLGKLIVATSEAQRERLAAIEKHAIDNGVTDLELLDTPALQSIEPALSAVAALYSPSTGIIDSHAYMLALQGEAEANGCQIAFQTRARSWQPELQGGFAIKCGDDESIIITCRKLIICGGLHASDFANAGPENSLVPSTQYAKGNYFRLQTSAPFRHLIYPVPEPGGLGVHLTLDMNRQARFGPDVEWVDKIDYEVAPARSEKFYAAIRDYWPDLPDESLVPDYSGIRPKLVGPGEPNADFKILQSTDHGFEGLTVLLGIESPGLTASLALAELV